MERLRRSFFFVPGGNERFLTKALGIDADCLCIDLEDSVAPDKKAAAREAVTEALRVSDFGRKEKIVRVNSILTKYGRLDIEGVIRGRPDTLLLPKVNRAQDILDYDAILTEEEKKAGLPERSVDLVAMIETALGIVNIEAIALASSRMKGLLFGAADYTRETRGRITPDRFELLYPMTRILLAARIAGIDAIDTPYFDVKNTEGLERHARQARDMGYDGKGVIHPAQLEVVHRVFTPTEHEVEYARRVIEAFEKARTEGK
ncbi:MAG: CoA ester lyase, partial [Desulfobacterales bacterium]|nr:CoA ester lyase [Desulfobacterales bacterium]